MGPILKNTMHMIPDWSYLLNFTLSPDQKYKAGSLSRLFGMENFFKSLKMLPLMGKKPPCTKTCIIVSLDF